MKWQSAYYSGYTTNETPPLSYEITNSTTMDVAPLVNSGTSLPFQLHFTFGGSDNTVVETGAVKIRVPRYLFQLPDGTHVGNFKTSLPLAPAIGGTTMCHYYIDGDDIVITNYAPISEATSLTFVMEYSVSPAAVPVDMVTGIYTNAVHATVTVQRDPAIEPESRDSNELVINYQTDAKLSRINKTGTSLEGWNPAWGAAPADSKDYFYVEWYIPITWNGYLPGVYPYTVGIPISQGFDLSLQDIAANGGQAVAWRTAYVSPSKNKVADTADMTDNWAEFHADMSPLASWHSPYPYEYYAWVYVTVRYPREGNIYWDAVSKTFKAKVTNTATATLDGLYNAYDQKTAAATHIYEEKPWFPEGAGGIYKRVYYHISSGMLTRLEQAGQLGLTGGILPFPNAGYVWNMQTDWVEDWARTKVGDVYGQQEWTAVRLDNEQYLNSAYGAASQYRLQPGDYSFTHIVLTRPGEQIYGEPSILGTNKLIPQPYANYGTVTVQASGTLSNDGPWADVATVTVNPDGTWNVTPAAGTGGAANLAETASHSLPLPPNTTGVRLLQTTKSARATQLYYLQTAYYPTPSLLAAIQASPTYIANREVDMHNKAWHWATGGGMPDSLRAQDSEYFRMTEFEGYSNILKTMRVTGSNSSLAQETAEVTITAHDVLPIPASTTLEEAIALGLLAEQRTGAFYDLLPPGVTFSPATIRTYRYSGRGDTLSSLIVPHTYEIIPDFRGTGCTMLIIRPSIPDGAASNYTVFDNNLRSGFTVQFSIYNSWQNIMDNGNTATNHVAYQSFADKPLFEGHSDIAPSTWLDYVEQAYLDVNGDGHDNAGDFLHAKSTLTFKLLPNIQIGYDKFVKAADENAYTKSTRVMGDGEYSYQLKLTTQAEAHASDLVFYDSLEMDAELPRGRETWMGTLLDYDITHPFRVYNVLPTVYYAARTMDPKAFDADRLFNRDTGELNPGWMLMPSDGSIPADLVSIAFDMRYDREGNPFVLGPELSLIIFMYMRAPADTAPYLPPVADPEILAWNTSFIQMKSAFPTETKEGIDTVNPTTVALRKPDLTLTKTSNPWTGTESAPARVHQDGTITYTVSVRNTNRVETIPNIVLEDDIPQGLIFDENADITVHFTGTAYLPIAQQPRVVMTRTGQKLSFAIDKLDPQETALFSIKTTVGAPTATSPTLFVNQAVVTRAFGVDQEIVSPPTYHKTNKISVTLPARKLLAAGGRVLQPGEFSIQLFDTSGQPVGGPIANDENGNFPITLWFGKPSSSTVIYRYFIREVIPETPEGNMTYHSTQYQWDVQIVYDYTPDTLRLYRSTLTPRLTPMEALFTNTYKASGQAAPTVYKIMQGRALAAGEFAFLLEAVGTAPMNGAAGLPLTLQARTVRNTLEVDGTGTAAFPALYYTEKDIGKTYQYIIRELPSGTPGVNDDTKTITWTVIVGDAGNGQLTFDTSYTDDDAVMGNEQSFLNSIETVSFTAKKRWELAEGITKPTIAIRLYQNGTTDMGYVRVNGIADDEEDMGFKPDGSGEQTPWEYTWETLPKYSYDADGNETENVYSAVEILVPDHFQHKVDADGTLVNTYRPGTFTGVKLWNGGKTSPVELRLFRTILGEENGARVEVYPGQTFPLDGQIDDPESEDGSGELTPWVYTWVNLPANTNALEGYTGPFQSFEYEIEEVKIPDGFAADTVTTPSRYITNIALKTDVTVTKLWRDTQRPYPAIRVQLIRDDEPFGDEVELTDGSTSYTWKDLDRFSVWDEDPKKRVEYVYTVSEVSMVGFDTYYSDDFRTITNYFVPPDPVEIVLRARKTLDGRAQKAGEFSFLLLSGGDEVLQSGIRNAADGTVLFQPIRFESPGEGIVFKMREAAGGDRDILYNASVYTLTYDVRLENDNSLSAHLVSLLKDGEEIALDSPLVFANALTPEARTYPVISVPLTARKTLSNGALMAGQFTFTLKDPSGQVVAEATNAADGSIVFPERTFSRKVSGYRFTISEKAGDTRQYTYDSAVYTVLVTTTPANGRLTASVSLEKDGAPYEGEILFANIQKLPPTGDSALAMPLWLLLGAFTLLAAAWLTRHRTKPAGRNH